MEESIAKIINETINELEKEADAQVIDYTNKKIIDASIAYADSKLDPNCPYSKNEQRKERQFDWCDLSDAFEDGAKWQRNSVWHITAQDPPMSLRLCVIVRDKETPLACNDNVIIAEPRRNKFVTRPYPHYMGYGVKHQGLEEGCSGVTPVYRNCRDKIPFDEVYKWAYFTDLFPINDK